MSLCLKCECSYRAEYSRRARGVPAGAVARRSLRRAGYADESTRRGHARRPVASAGDEDRSNPRNVRQAADRRGSRDQRRDRSARPAQRDDAAAPRPLLLGRAQSGRQSLDGSPRAHRRERRRRDVPHARSGIHIRQGGHDQGARRADERAQLSSGRHDLRRGRGLAVPRHRQERQDHLHAALSRRQDAHDRRAADARHAQRKRHVRHAAAPRRAPRR